MSLTAEVTSSATECHLTIDEWRLLSAECPAPELGSDGDVRRNRAGRALSSLVVRGLASQRGNEAVQLHPVVNWIAMVCTEATRVVDLVRTGEGEPLAVQVLESPYGRLTASPVGLGIVRITAISKDQLLSDQVAVLVEPLFSSEQLIELFVRDWSTDGQRMCGLVHTESGWEIGYEGVPATEAHDPKGELLAFIQGMGPTAPQG